MGATTNLHCLANKCQVQATSRADGPPHSDKKLLARMVRPNVGRRLSTGYRPAIVTTHILGGFNFLQYEM